MGARASGPFFLILNEIPASFDSLVERPEFQSSWDRGLNGGSARPWRQFIDGSPSPLNEYFRDFSIIFLEIKGLGLPVRFSGDRLSSRE
jgi:hypothetical protein